jgi:hypothetical protein
MKKMFVIGIMLLLVLSVSIAVIGANIEDTDIQHKEKIMPSRVIEKTVRIEKQSLDELKKDNIEHIKFLRNNLEPEIAQKIIDKYFALRAEELEKLLDGEEVRIKLIEIGSNSPSLWPYTSYTSGSFVKADPVNLIFYNIGSAVQVQYNMINRLTNDWEYAAGWTQYMYIGTTDGGLSWRENDYQLQDGSYWTTRYHIRIFDGGYDPDWAHSWSAANVYWEYWDWSSAEHIVVSYEQAEDHVKNDFQGKWFVGSIWYTNLDNSDLGDNDGNAPVIELTEP